MGRKGFWKVYLVAGIAALLVIGLIIYWNFYSPYQPQDAQTQYDSAQLAFTVVGIFGVIFSLLFAADQFAQGQRSPQLRLVFAESGTASHTIRVEPRAQAITNVPFCIINDGNVVARWFVVEAHFSNIPWSGNYVAPAWAQKAEHWESSPGGFRLMSFGTAAVFTSAPLQVGVVQFFDIRAQRESKHELRYQIDGDWGSPVKGSLWLKFEVCETKG